MAGKEMIDGKEAIDGKRILDNKDIPAEGPPEAPAEGPPPCASAGAALYLYPGGASDQPLTINQLRLRGPVRWRENVGWRVSRIGPVGRTEMDSFWLAHQRRGA